MNKTRCGLYTRVSTEHQVRKDFNSLESQRQLLEKYVEDRDDLALHEVYEDGGYSAASLDRPALKRLLRDIRLERIKCVIAYRLDRLTRSGKDLYELMEFFNEFGVSFISVSEFWDTNTAAGRMQQNLVVSVSQYEREVIAERTRDKMRQRAEKGMWNGGRPPYGYRNKNKKLVIYRSEARRVRFMFEYFAKNPSIADLRLELRRKGWFTRGGNPWGKTSLAHIIGNPIYAGKIRADGKTCPGVHKGIVSDKLFRKAQSVTRHQTHAKMSFDQRALLKGLLKCGYCGSAMTPHSTKKRQRDGSIKRYVYYRCSATLHYDKSVCNIRQVSADQVEQEVIEHIADLSRGATFLNDTVKRLNGDLRRNRDPLEKRLAMAKRRRTAIESEIHNYVRALGKGKLSASYLEKEVEDRQDDLNALASECEELERQITQNSVEYFNAEIVRRTLQDFHTVFQNLTPREQNEALQYVIKEVVLEEDKLLLELFELDGFPESSQKRTARLPALDSNLIRRPRQRQVLYYRERT